MYPQVDLAVEHDFAWVEELNELLARATLHYCSNAIGDYEPQHVANFAWGMSSLGFSGFFQSDGARSVHHLLQARIVREVRLSCFSCGHQKTVTDPTSAATTKSWSPQHIANFTHAMVRGPENAAGVARTDYSFEEEVQADPVVHITPWSTFSQENVQRGAPARPSIAGLPQAERPLLT
ncbi:unnamed protein product, partial [Amoebophrya sp. A120]|eukprot:GSA120T00024152001.1